MARSTVPTSVCSSVTGATAGEGDLDDSGVVDGADLGLLLGAWGICPDPEPDPCPADLNDDGTVDGADLGLLLGNWGGADLGDLDDSGVVDGADLGLLLGAWGPCDPQGPCPGEGDCCAANGTPGCDDATCCDTVCGNDPFCCDNQWDQLCADAAIVDCAGCVGVTPCPGDGDCFIANGTPGCDDEACCEAICAQDPFCCDVEWDQICADAAINLCGP